MSDPTTRSRLATRSAAWLTFAGFAAVISAIELMAVRGQLDFAEHVMGLSDAWVYVVPVALEGGTLVSAALALWATLTRDPSLSHRIWTMLFLGGAALANYLGALAAGRNTIAALYLAAFAIAALRMWHAILHRLRRSDLHALGAIEPPLARFRMLRWIPGIAFRETFAAWRFSIREGVTRPADALAAVRGNVLPPVVATAEGTAVDLSTVSKAEAVRTAFAEIGSYEVPAAMEWLTRHGVKVDRSYVYEIGRKLAADRRRELHAVTGDEKAS